MIKRYIALVVVLVVATGLLVGHAFGVQFTSTVPGSADDPLVTKGYVDEQMAKFATNFEQLEQEYRQKLNDVLVGGVGEVGGNELIVVELFPGDVLKAKAGTELIVRTGRTHIVAGENGIPDVTAGKDLAANTLVPLNHQLIVPRDDGRGIKSDPSSASPVFVMVRGGYDITRAQ
ncbi:hypothetical protein [Desulfuribacillus alkaliarsenatis]|uniref:Uncharacterized protein n=1 Tax=Desulfuribacillus alkaliarsenatis TaxID=766136 RepID=A0A1E5G3L1_9FIRM|nr:hypothetical protein [Desulfuribacillus alkaliarsenatis]OEF97650.1 hypothetical protein BHF68_14485 [Desulfuribacillus alkaliarsenatis]